MCVWKILAVKYVVSGMLSLSDNVLCMAAELLDVVFFIRV